MAEFELYAVVGCELVELPVSQAVADVHDLFESRGSAQSGPAAIYSALCTYQGNRFVRLDAHMARTQRCLDRVGWSTRFDVAGLSRALHTTVTRTAGDKRLRFDVLQRPVAFGAVSTEVLLGLGPHHPVPPTAHSLGVRLALAPPGLRRPQPLVKFTDWVNVRRVCQRANPAYEHLLLDDDQRILEGTSSNFFALTGDTLITAGDGVLEGITRQVVLELAEQRGLKVELRRLRVSELSMCREAFITSSTRELVPVCAVEGVAIGSGRPGPTVAELLADYRRFAFAHARTAAPAVA
jgi:branched-subunit amino acid aminotransferase/4-amino-4-deoxychorismate lyase